MDPTPAQNRCLFQRGEYLLGYLEGPALMVERLYEIGFLPGEHFSVLGKIPFGGPWLICVRGVTVALRESEAECLRV